MSLKLSQELYLIIGEFRNLISFVLKKVLFFLSRSFEIYEKRKLEEASKLDESMGSTLSNFSLKAEEI